MESSILKPTPSEAHPETLDFLSSSWCNFAVQAMQPPDHHHNLQDSSILLLDHHAITKSDHNCSPQNKTHFSRKMDFNKLNDVDDFNPLPPWKSNDFKSWIWMQQAMHPEVNYNSCFRKKWLPWKVIPFRTVSIKKWLKERKQKRKEEDRLKRAEVHAAMSVAGVAAALAAIASENSKDHSGTAGTKEAAVASAAALVAAQCAQVAEAMGARREQMSSVIGSAMSGTSASDILTLTAAATTSIRGAATLKARTECSNNRLNGSAPVLPLEDNSMESDLDFHKSRSILASGTEMHVETPDGNFRARWVSVVLSSKAKVILKMKKLNLFQRKKESIILDMHAELYNDAEDDGPDQTETCYLIVLTTNLGIVKLDMGDDYHRYKTWAEAITHMLMLSTSYSKYELQFYKN